MKSLTLVFGVSCLVGLGFFIQARAQQAGDSTQRASIVEKVSSSRKKIGFRLPVWKTIHSHSEQTALQDMKTLKDLGCEVTSDSHGDHIDIRYRCVQWKTMEVPTDQLVQQWSSWLDEKELETVVVNPPAATAKHAVRFRLVANKTLHLHDPQQAQEIINTLQMIGVKVSTNDHGNHLDATLTCPDWQTIDLPSDHNAHVWQDWLRKNGFETQHSH